MPALFAEQRVFLLWCYGVHRDLHSFPTRRSSDLRSARAGGQAGGYCAAADARGDREPSAPPFGRGRDRKSTRLNSSHPSNSYAVFCLKKKKKQLDEAPERGVFTTVESYL